MDDYNRNLPSCGTQIDDLPSCLIMDILLRLPNRSLLSCRVVCRSWNLIFSDPLFVKLHFARSPTYHIRGNHEKPMKFYTRYCRSLVPGMSSEASSSSQANDRLRESKYTCINSSHGLLCLENTLWLSRDALQDSKYTCINSSNGLLCLENYGSPDEVYVCNPILGQYITVKTGNTEIVRFYLGFSSRSNQFKVLKIMYTPPYLARIYTIGDGTRQWKSVGVAPSCRSFRFGCFLNGSIHWVDDLTQEIFYFNFDSEQFGSLPSPSLPVGRRRYGIVGVLDGCLFFYAPPEKECWIMKEYGVEESWTKILSIDNYEKNFLLYDTTYNPSFISLQDVAKGEQLTFIS